jgi:parallel beta-helix repeat protein
MPANDASQPSKREIFVVYGRNTRLRDGMYEFLRALDLAPISWEEAKARTGKGAPSIDEILRQGLHDAHAVLVIMSGDDEARLLPAFHKPDDRKEDTEFTPQCRPNVLFEAGMAHVLFEDRTILVVFGRTRGLSDLSGVHFERVEKGFDEEERFALRNQLKAIECDVNDSNRIWLKAGDQAFKEGMGVLTTSMPCVRIEGDPKTYTSISQAIKAARPGAHILVYPGKYPEALIIDRPVLIEGVGARTDIVVEGSTTNTVFFRASKARIANLTIKRGPEGHGHAVMIEQGQLELAECDITSACATGDCVLIRGDEADPLLLRNRIFDGKKGGVLIEREATGRLEGNDIFGHKLAGVTIANRARPLLIGNKIQQNQQEGIYFFGEGGGVIQDNDISDNRLAGVAIRSGSHPVLVYNRIHNGGDHGVYVEDGLGFLSENHIYDNQKYGVMIKSGGDPTLRLNRITGNGWEGVRIDANGLGTIEDDNELARNKSATGPQLSCAGDATPKRIADRYR